MSDIGSITLTDTQDYMGRNLGICTVGPMTLEVWVDLAHLIRPVDGEPQPITIEEVVFGP